MNGPDYTIQDLCELTDLPRRTIHFYTQQGILPPPSGAGLGARYGETHLLRLRLIPYFRRKGLRLDDIHSKFEELDLEALRGYLSQSKIVEPQPSQPKGQAFIHYPLPAGMTLTVPTSLSPSNRGRLSQLLKQSQQIFQISENTKEQ